MPRAPNVKGFTLIEMMLVAVLIGIVGLAIVATFAGGLKLFHRVESYTAAKADVLLSLERMERDLRNTFSLKGIDFIGESHRVTFPAILNGVSSKGQVAESPGSICYFRDDNGHDRALSREEITYAQAVHEENSGHGPITALASIEDIQLQYFSYDPEAGTCRWGDVWDKSEARKEREEKGEEASQDVAGLEHRPEDIPLGVKIKINYADGGKILTMSRTVFIKTAVSLNLAKRREKTEKDHSKEARSE
ncbi:MAG: prepilin-type N-terminal cleavage/methylation domain-containing protein [Candidatus Omnitrophota bacterium]